MSIKRFNNALIYRMSSETENVDVEQMSTRLSGHAHRDIGKSEISTAGFIPPFGEPDSFVEPVGPGMLFLSVGKTERMLPGKVVRRETDERIAKIEAEQARRVYAKERTQIKEEVIQDLLPRAFLNHTRIDVLICGRYVFIDTSSPKKAEEVLNLLRTALGRFPVLPLTAEHSVAVTMTSWTRNGNPPEPFSLGEAFQSRGISEKTSTLSGKGVDLSAEGLHDALDAGDQQVHRMQLIYRDGDTVLPFTLTESIGLKGIRWPKEFVDQISEDVGEDGDPVTEMRATLLLLGTTLRCLIGDLRRALGNPDADETADDSEALI